MNHNNPRPLFGKNRLLSNESKMGIIFNIAG